MRESIDRIRRALNEGGLKKSKLAEEAGVNPDTLTDVDKPDWYPRPRTVEKLVTALDRIAQRLAA